MQAALVMFKADGSRKDFPIKIGKRYIIGRKEDCDLRIPLSNVSREHAAVFFDEEDEEFVIEDLGSSNGTVVNKDVLRKSRRELLPGDVIVVGSVPFQVVINGHPAEVKPIRIASPNEGEEGSPASGDARTVSSAPGDSDSFFDFDLDDED